MSLHQVIIALGSNTDPIKNLASANKQIGSILSFVNTSKALWTKPIGIKSDEFLNQLVTGETSLSQAELEELLKKIERVLGRTTQESRQGIIRIDIDLLKFDDKKCHVDDWSREYIKALMNNIK